MCIYNPLYSLAMLNDPVSQPNHKSPAGKMRTRIAILEGDPLRLIGFRMLFESEPSIELVVSTLGEIGSQKEIEIALLGSQNHQNIFETIAGLKAARPDLCVLVTQAGADDEMILKVLIGGLPPPPVKGIGERTVKAHVAKLLRKVGVRNRVALSVHAITNSLLKEK